MGCGKQSIDLTQMATGSTGDKAYFDYYSSVGEIDALANGVLDS